MHVMQIYAQKPFGDLFYADDDAKMQGKISHCILKFNG